MSHIYKKEKCRSMKKEMQKHEKRNAEAWKEKCGSMKTEMQKHEKRNVEAWKKKCGSMKTKKCRRQVNLIGRAKFGNDIKQKSTTDGVYRLFARRQHDG